LEPALEHINALLPQTQCRQCGFNGCADYARALVERRAPVNRCAPGGNRGIAKLAAALGVAILPLDPDYGREMPLAFARIDPDRCIGCRICADCCPVDAITGLTKHLFAVIESACTGCALCVSPCPMDCIELVDANREWTEQDAAAARVASEAKKRRLLHMHEELEARSREASLNKKSLVANAIALARAKK